MKELPSPKFSARAVETIAQTATILCSLFTEIAQMERFMLGRVEKMIRPLPAKAAHETNSKVVLDIEQQIASRDSCTQFGLDNNRRPGHGKTTICAKIRRRLWDETLLSNAIAARAVRNLERKTGMENITIARMDGMYFR